MNTIITYLYRDCSNYKSFNAAVLEGEIAEDKIEKIVSCLDEEKLFYSSTDRTAGETIRRQSYGRRSFLV